MNRARKTSNTSHDTEITIIVPARNRAGLLPRTLASVSAQTHRPLSVVLVDNDSRDDTLGVMRRWAAEVDSDITVKIVSETRHGATHARNRGAAEVTTPYMMFFDSDDEMLPCHVADIAAAIESNGWPDIVGRSVAQRLLSGKTTLGRFSRHNLMVNHLFHGCLSTQRYAVRTELYRQAGGWDTRAWGWDDYELGIRLLLLEPRVAVVEGQSVIVHSQADSITGTDFSSSPAKWENTLDLCQADFDRSPFAPLSRWIDCRRIILAADYAREGSRTLARQLKKSAIKHSHAPLRMTLLYHQHRLMRRGSAMLARLMFHPRRNKTK